jgi:starvation-inducible DNA-binding protein
MYNKEIIHPATENKNESAENVGNSAYMRSEVANSLSYALATIHVLYHKTLFYHWNVTGPHFASLHKLFEGQYLELQKNGDLIAERIRALGYFSPGTMAEFIELSHIKEDKKLPASTEEMIHNLLKAHETCSKDCKQVMNLAEIAEDFATADMMVDQMKFHDKNAWMLRSLQE